MGLMEAIVEGSFIFREGRKKGAAQGLAKGEAQGKTAEALRLAIAERFPGLEDSPELDRIEDLAELESLLLRHAFREPDRDSMEQAISAAAARQN